MGRGRPKLSNEDILKKEELLKIYINRRCQIREEINKRTVDLVKERDILTQKINILNFQIDRYNRSK